MAARGKTTKRKRRQLDAAQQSIRKGILDGRRAYKQFMAEHGIHIHKLTRYR